LLQTGTAHGIDSPLWQARVSAGDGLLWSFQPKTVAEDRKLLAQRLPSILKTLKDGMQYIGVATTEQEAFLDACFRLQTQALRATQEMNPSTLDNSSSNRLPTSNQPPIDGELREGNVLLRTLDFAELQPPINRTARYELGDWLAIQLADGTSCLGCICHIAQFSHRVLLINPECGLAIAVHPAILDRQLREGDASIRSGCSLFDHAASRALGQTQRN
jgi:hypothetical protein